MNWFELRIFLAPPNAPGNTSQWKDIFSSRLFEMGAQGVVEDTGYVSGYFPEDVKEKVTSEWQPYYATVRDSSLARWEWCLVPEVDWVEKYKEHFKAQKLTNLFFLQPAWDETSRIPAEMIGIRMELGQAFGTGLHASTRLALRLLQSVVGRFWSPEHLSLLDVGTGTGILAIAAEKLGLGTLLANDIDAPSIDVARENIEANRCRKIELTTRPLEAIKGQYDIVLANILLETHRQLERDYARVCKQDGFLILSGFLSHQVGPYLRSLPKGEWKVIQHASLQEWGACLLGRR